MHCSAKHGLAITCRLSICLSVCQSVCDVGGSGPYRLKILEINCASNYLNIFALRSPKVIHLLPREQVDLKFWGDWRWGGTGQTDRRRDESTAKPLGLLAKKRVNMDRQTDGQTDRQADRRRDESTTRPYGLLAKKRVNGDRRTDDRQLNYKTSNPGWLGLLTKKRVNTDRQTDGQTDRQTQRWIHYKTIWTTRQKTS